ncbi:hypothetical protein RCO28_19765 [Streptomyces sp. LHD-70]|uniref:hypothetical protein n=1 Tax=Streptomyces sp. LHD-70 TaxID=3072140 RepID=UPI00280C9E41|nr:hypothetical protein [Streptomyces sp. LHD-70]MDQ8704712.1 hypothetical protein [Streptomyces sp. LHD-70]
MTRPPTPSRPFGSYTEEQVREEGLRLAHAKGLTGYLAEWYVESFLEVCAEAHAEGYAEGHAEACAEGCADALEAIFRRRGLDVPDGLRERVMSCRDDEMLGEWISRSLTVESASDIFDGGAQP